MSKRRIESETLADAEATATSQNHVTLLVESSTVRNQLYRQEPRLPTIPLPGVSLIATTSMLFIKDLLERAVQNNDSSDLVDASLLRRTVQQTPSFSFLETALEGVNDSTPPREFRPTNNKRKRSATNTLTTSNKKSIAEASDALQDHGTTTAVPGVSTEILVDEDDYD